MSLDVAIERWRLFDPLDVDQILFHPPLRGFAQNRPLSCFLHKREQTIWQHRYWEHQICDDLDFERHCDYLHYNPVKHGFVTRVVDWPHSSFHRFVDNGMYPLHWAGNPELLDTAGFGE